MHHLFLARMKGWLMPGWFAHILQKGFILGVIVSQPSSLHPASLIVNFEGSEILFGESSLPIGSSIFVVAPTGTENAFYTSLSQVSSAGAMASFLSNSSNLKFYNSEPVNYGTDNGGSPDDGTFRGWLEGGLTPGPAQIGTADNTASRRLFLLISTSANSSFDSTTSFLLLRQRASPNGSDLGVPIDSIETPFFANVSSDATTGMDVIFGEFLGNNTYRLSQAAGYGQITSATALTMNAGATPLTYQILSNNGANSFGITSLPTWASLNSVTGVITLAPGASISGTFTLGLSAINSLTGKTATGSLAVTVVAPPVITSTLTATATRGTAFTYQIAADNSPTSFNATGLPGGLSINTSNGRISGTPNVAAGTFNVTLSATNTAGTGTATLVITLSAAPVISSTLTATANRGSAFSYQIAADSVPISFNATGLPGGLSINTSNGRISGTPNVAAGTFNVTLSATNSTGTGTATLVITLSAAPVISSTLTATATRGSAFSYQIAADSVPTSFNATGLPGGLSINTSNGRISGTPNVAAGTFNVTLSATNAAGTGTATLTINLSEPIAGAPVITSTLTATATRGTAFTYQISANSSPTSYNATGLPGGLSINTRTGVISGTPNVAAGTFNVTLSATNGAGTGTTNLIITLNAAPVITSTLTATATRGTAFTYQITADSSPTSFNATGLPGGLSINTTTGAISGTPNVAAGTFNVTLSATNSTGTGTATLVLDLTSPSLSIPSLISNRLTRTAGSAYSIPVTIPTGFTVDSYTLQPAIPGVSYSAGNLFISSTATPFAKGTTKESLTLTLNRTTGLNGAKISASLTFDLRLEAPTPRLLTTRGPFEVTVGDDYSLQLLTDVSTLCPNQNFRIVGTLPPGLAISTGGLISGVNRSTSSPDTYETRFAADTTQYEGGGVFISPPVTFLLRNNPPVISSASRAHAGVLLKKFSYTLQTDTDNHVDSEILGVLPPGVVSRKSGLGNSTIILEGYPTESGIYKNILVAKNYLRPGNASTLQETSMELVTYVFGRDTSVKQELNSASLTTLVRGVAIGTNTPLRLTSGALSEGTYVVASSTSFRPISRPNDKRYEFLPGILLDPFTGIISGTPTTSGTFQVTVSFMNARKIEKTAVTLKVR